MTTSTPRLFVSRRISLRDVLLVMVDHLRGAQGPRALQLLVTRRWQSRALPGACDLNGRLANAAAGGKYQHVLASLELARVINICHAVTNDSGNAAA